MRSISAKKTSSLLLSALILATALATGCQKAEDSSQPQVSSTTAAQTSSKAETTAAASSSAADDYVVKIGYGGSLCEAALHIAQEKGFLEEQGVKVEYIKLESGTGFANITSGNIDVTFALLASLVEPLANGLEAQITTGIHTGCDKVLVKPDSGIESAEDLIGKKVGVSGFTASPYVFLKRVLADNGVTVTKTESQVDFVVFPSSDLPLSLSNDAVDAIAMNDPAAYIAAEEYGYKVLYDSATDKPYDEQYCCSVYMGNQFIDSHPELAQKVTAAIQLASEWVQNNPDETAQIQLDKKWVAAGTPENNARVLKTFNYIPSAVEAKEAFNTVVGNMVDLGMIEAENVNKDKLVEDSFKIFDNLPFK